MRQCSDLTDLDWLSLAGERFLPIVCFGASFPPLSKLHAYDLRDVQTCVIHGYTSSSLRCAAATPVLDRERLKVENEHLMSESSDGIRYSGNIGYDRHGLV